MSELCNENTKNMKALLGCINKSMEARVREVMSSTLQNAGHTIPGMLNQVLAPDQLFTTPVLFSTASPT